ncbi:hypothetical protein BCV69DRAFT_266465 [Microstroma glucosiphilum]|uniref:Nudix hydrolase domain-containing protein n=1 Tax=Pseudomicrostroma glucosiphilum TaxID=1684307 RepID=A0A316UCR8_9BASI|nr:hypothetical protein BCV69DRAFT_266465 [Pseudomicrostroma glucosiphilum]PWN22952.1 hypothetical protein BCV69DRAFT_266465 [Pseudomicrostroma glucosiphilum]
MAPSHTLPALHHALSRLSVTKPRIISSPPTQPRRASVALILRIRPHVDDEEYLSQHQRRSRSRRSSIASSSSRSGAAGKTSTQRTLSSFFSLPWVQRGVPEILYIKRATRATDKWSAHVAFPGGRRDETDEDALYTAMRETWEEVGLDLADRDFLKIGQLDDREITSSLGKRLLMVLSPFVFLQTTPFSHHPELQPTEVASAHWVSLAHLYTPKPRWGTVSIDIATRLAPKSSGIRFLLKGLLGKMDFRCVLLPNDPWAIADEDDDTASGDSDGPQGVERARRKREVRTEAVKSVKDGSDLQLWGLTLGMTIDLLAHMSTFPSAPSKSSSAQPVSLQSILHTTPSQLPSLFRKVAVRMRDELHLNPPPMADAKAPSLTSVYPRFSNTDVNFWIWVFGARYRYIVRSWASSLGGPSERTYNWSGLALGAFYTAVRRALIVAIALRALGALGMATLAVWLGRRRVIRARRGLPGLGLDEVLRA